MRYTFLALSGLMLASAVQAQNNTLTQAEIAAGYQLLFNGTSVSSGGNGIDWVTYQQGNDNSTTLEASWKVYPSDSAFGKEGNGPRDIRTKKKFKDFTAEFEFKTDGNSGFYYRTTVEYGYGWGTGVEYAIENNSTLLPWIRSGAAYELIAPAVGNYAGTNKWNTVKVIAIKDSVEHWLNGVKVVAFKYWDAQWQKALRGELPYTNGQRSKWDGFQTFCKPKTGSLNYIDEGYFGLQGDHPGATKFRNFKVAPLTQWPFPVAIGSTQDKDAGVRATLLSRIEIRNIGQETSLSVDFAKPYEVTVRDFKGRIVLPAVDGSDSKIIHLDRATFRSGIYFAQVKVAGMLLSKAFTIR